MSKFEKRFGKYAISNLSLILILCYVVGYFIELVNADFLLYLTLNPYAILHGQIWRIFTWIIIPPSSLDPFTIIMLLFYYNIGTSLERTWGTYRYALYRDGKFRMAGHRVFCRRTRHEPELYFHDCVTLFQHLLH